MLPNVPESWRAHLDGLAALVFAAPDTTDEWEAVKTILTAAFEASQIAAVDGSPIVYVVHTDDLLGRRGAGRAMVATGLLSAARTAALESARAGIPVNVLAIDDDSPVESICRWVLTLCEPGGPTGELIHLGPRHIGKALA